MIQLRKLISEQSESGLDTTLLAHKAAFTQLRDSMKRIDYVGIYHT